MSIPEIEKIKWRCRLGMLELDTLFLQFIEKKEHHLTCEELQLLSELLAMDNYKLEQWLIKAPKTVEGKYARICADILVVARQ